jgi:cellulose synthase (UDP-forming)
MTIIGHGLALRFIMIFFQISQSFCLLLCQINKNNFMPLSSSKIHSNPKNDFLETEARKNLIVLTAFSAIVYFIVIAFFFPLGNRILFGILIAGEVFHMWQILTFLYTVWDFKQSVPLDQKFMPPVDIYITVAGEPKDLVAITIQAVKEMDYPNFQVYILNDGFVAKKENWQEMEDLAKEMSVHVITRKVAGGAKAGNINNALKQTKNPYIVIFDADHIPHKDFLTKMIPHFSDSKVAFVQSPQYYKNYEMNYVTAGSWEQQELFFGPICKGKNRLNSITMCGTNMAISRQALLDVGGMCEDSIAEDFATGLFMHQKGWKSIYVAEVLAEGLAPEDFLSYYKQQFRWARGGLDVVFKYNLLFMRGLTWQQKIQYLASASFNLTGIVVLADAVIPLIFFFTGAVPFLVSTMLLAAVFLPYIFLTLYTLLSVSNVCYTFRSLSFSLSSFSIQLRALWSVISGEKPKFDITSKKQVQGNFIYLAWPHIGYAILVVSGVIFAIMREGFSASVVVNFAWALLNVAVFSDFVRATLPDRINIKP